MSDRPFCDHPSPMEPCHLIRSAIFGCIIGDALGVPVEFAPRQALARRPVTGMRAGGDRGYPAGTWPDDSSMTLCTLASLTACGRLDVDDLMGRFVKWAQEGYMTPTGRAFGIGRTTAAAIYRFLRGAPALTCGGQRERDNGNGSLMRILPAVLFNFLCRAGTPVEERLELIYDASRLTHAHPRSLLACGIYSFVAEELLRVPERASISLGLGRAEAFYRGHDAFPPFARLFSAEFAALPMEEIGSGGYVVDTLEAALWCLWNSDSYESCVLKAVNLGGDTDTVAAIAGGLAGILYGDEALPEEWVGALADAQMIEGLCRAAAEAWGRQAPPKVPSGPISRID